MGSIAGFVPEFGLLTDEGRKAHLAHRGEVPEAVRSRSFWARPSA